MMERTQSRQLRWQFAYEHVRAGLLEGRHRPGESIKVIDIAAELGMSRYSVMDALKQLAAEQFVEILPQVGCRVVRLDMDEVGMHLRFVARCEGFLAEMAVERGTDAKRREVERIARAIESLPRDGMDDLAQLRHYRLLNRQFHGAVHDMGAAPKVAEAVARMYDRNDFYMAAVPGLLFLDRLEDAVEEHRAILTAIEAHDPVAARTAAEDHALHINDQIQGLLRAAASGAVPGR
jgi:DNA-binding GntR family transcriptional regulator